MGTNVVQSFMCIINHYLIYVLSINAIPQFVITEKHSESVSSHKKKKSKKEKEKDKSRTKRHEEGLSKYLKRHLQLIDSSKVRFLLLSVHTK